MKKYIFTVLLGLCFAGTAIAAGAGAELYDKSCKGCHGADGTKVGMGMTKPLKGMPAADSTKALAGYKAGTFGGEKKAMMERICKGLTDEQIKDLAAHIATF